MSRVGKVNNLKFNGFGALKYVGGDLFKNDGSRNSMAACFYGCEQLISIPDGLFDNCPNVENFYNCFYSCIQLTSIPSGLFDNYSNVTNFSNCFMFCYALQLFESKITKIDPWMFRFCSSLTLVQINNDTVTTLANTNAFDATNAALQIKVPANLVDSYKAATNWISLADKITAI